MSVYKRGQTWWYSFWFAEKRIQEPAKTKSKTLAREAEQARRRELERGYNGVSADDRGRRVLTFSEAAKAFLADYQLRRRLKSYKFMKNCVHHLEGHFGDMMLIEISNKVIAEYQAVRLKEKASGCSINSEVMFALRVMGEIGDAVRAKLRREKRLRLPVDNKTGKALIHRRKKPCLRRLRFQKCQRAKRWIRKPQNRR